MAWTIFAQTYPLEALPGDGKSNPMTPDQLRLCNLNVNRGIRPMRIAVNDTWIIWPADGNCNDFAVTKRHALLSAGHDPADLLLAECVLHSGEHHLVLIARTVSADYALDNLTYFLDRWDTRPYRYLRCQSQAHPNEWRAVVA